MTRPPAWGARASSSTRWGPATTAPPPPARRPPATPRVGSRKWCGCIRGVVVRAGDSAPARLHTARPTVLNQIVDDMQARGPLLTAETRRQCAALLRAFHASLKAGDSARFQRVLMAT